MVAPSDPTYFTKKSKSKIDFFLISKSLFPLVSSIATDLTFRAKGVSGHRPVTMKVDLDCEILFAQLRRPKKFPAVPPFGPMPELQPWNNLASAVDLLGRQMQSDLPHPVKQRLLDLFYAGLFAAMNAALNTIMGLSLDRTWSCRGPSVFWKPPQPQTPESWVSRAEPIQWAVQAIANVHRAIAIKEPLESALSILAQPPSDLSPLPQAVSLHVDQAVEACRQIAPDGKSLATSTEQAEALLSPISTALEQALETELRHEKEDGTKAWRNWVHQATSSSVGWAHRWTKDAPAWQPTHVQIGSSWSARPSAMLEGEAARLSRLWQTSSSLLKPFAPEGPSLPRLSANDIREASRSFPAKTAQTFDGFHPRHLSLLTDSHLEAISPFFFAAEEHGSSPTAAMAIITALLQKAKPKGPGIPAFGGIALIPALYRARAKYRQALARAWEEAHRRPFIGHQQNRSIEETVFLQALEP